VLLDAIERAGTTDRVSVRNALKTANYKAVTGNIKFDENRNPIKSVVILEIKDGKQVYRTTVNP
jgi:branched-chain amino acid transport system substrate-binding protein